MFQWSTNCFDKKTSGGGIKNENISNKELAKELKNQLLEKPIINKGKVDSPFIDNIWGVDLLNMLLRSKFNIGFRFLLCVIDIYSKNACAIPLEDKKCCSWKIH